MAQISYDFYKSESNYASHDVKSTGSYSVNMADLMRYSVTNGGFSHKKVSHRGRPFYRELVRFAVSESATGTELVRTEDYACAEQSILTAVSFFVGMIFARAYAEKVLHCRYLFHLADKRIDPEANSRTRPDFYGESKKGPFLIEAKGTSKTRVDNLTIKHASEQLAGIRSVNGISANDIDKYTIATSFVSGRNGRVLTQSVVDPVGAFEEDINFDLDKAAYYYYEGITSLFEDPAIQQVRFSSHLGYVFVDLDDFMIGIEEDVLNLMRNVNPVTPDGCYYKLRRALDSGSSLAKQAFASGPAKGKRVEQYSVGGDGLIFEIVNDQL